MEPELFPKSLSSRISPRRTFSLTMTGIQLIVNEICVCWERGYQKVRGKYQRSLLIIYLGQLKFNVESSRAITHD